MAGIFDRDLGTSASQDTEARIAEITEYINYMQRAMEDNNTITNRKIATLEARIKQLEA